METDAHQKEISVAFINDKSSVLDEICKSLATSGTEILFRSEHIKDGLFQLSALKTLPKVCVIDLDFYSKEIIQQLIEIKTQYPSIKLIAHSDIDDQKVGKDLFVIGFSSYLFVGSDVDDFRKVIKVVINGGRYFSMEVAEISKEYFGKNQKHKIVIP
ncbi:response regulator transcription factor [Flavobacterium hiemivividum]|uniref:Response regulator transcription factor n=1 Tax=Flavobacterium hiemivividum TaxID=2541734 RepID=A0A4R5CYR7_9FLAO|nr:response regulator transcription factor [Flavobacterium hiemivividum]TDE04987.1 response regulator transcription factor [Flavobacterium hiemivividum]